MAFCISRLRRADIDFARGFRLFLIKHLAFSIGRGSIYIFAALSAECLTLIEAIMLLFPVRGFAVAHSRNFVAIHAYNYLQ